MTRSQAARRVLTAELSASEGSGGPSDVQHQLPTGTVGAGWERDHVISADVTFIAEHRGSDGHQVLYDIPDGI